MTLRLTLAGLCLAGTLMTVGALQSEAGDTDLPFVREGIYRDLTFMRKLKLGTAPFVNPDLLKTTDVAWVYPAWQLGVGFAAVESKLEAGEATFAVQSNGTYKALDWSAYAKAGGDVEKLKGMKFFILSKSDDLFGVKPAKRVVSWSAGDPLAQMRP